jgi:hypothetical protein
VGRQDDEGTAGCLVEPDRCDGLWAVWNGWTSDPRASGGGWAWTVVASPDGVSHQNIWPGPKTADAARALADALRSAADWHDRVSA